MRTILALLLLGLGSAVTCLSLEPLCPSDHFDYQDVRVNAIHRVQANVTLEPFSEFVVPLFDNCLSLSWQYASYKKNAEEIKDYYNNILIRLYSERFLNAKGLDQNSFENQLSGVKTVLAGMEKIRSYEFSTVANCLKEKFIPPMKNGVELIKHLASLYGEQLPQTDVRGLRLGKDIMFRKFDSEINRIASNLTNSQTMAFQFDFITEVYKKPIIRMGKFVFHKKSKVVFDLSSFGTLNLEMIFPFEDTDLQAGNDCVSTADLPKFFPNPRPVTETPAYEDPTGTTRSYEDPTGTTRA